MPRTYPPRRTLVGVRIDADVLAEVDAQAKAFGVDRSTTIRALLAESLAAGGRKTPPLPRARGDGRSKGGA